MKFIQLLFTLAPVALASPVSRSEGSQDVHIVLELSKLSSQAAVTVWNADQTEIVAKSCTDSLATGPFEKLPIVFKVGENGAGRLTVGDAAYLIGGGDADNALECGRISSETELVVNCVVSIYGGVELRSLDKRGLKECFPDGPLEVAQAMDVFEGKVDAEMPSNLTSPEDSQEEVAEVVERAHIEQRQANCLWGSLTRTVSNPNPYQNPLNIQLSEPMLCPSHIGCSTYYTMTKSFSIGWQGNAGTWLSGGFSVVRTIETGNSYVCNGNPNDFFAVWKNQGQTAYNVQNGLFNPCTNMFQPVGAQSRIWSPNANNRRGYYYCVYGRGYVRAIGDRWLDTAGHTPGGP